MKRKCLSVLLALCLLCAGAPAFAASAVVARAIEIIVYFECGGDYGCVTADTNGSPSLGILQWNAEGAAALMRKIIAADPETAKALLGDALYGEIADNANSAYVGRKFSSAEKKKIAACLESDAGKEVQDALAEKNVTAFVDEAKALGIADKNALCYYADIRNQVGSGAIKKYHVKAAEIAGSYEKIALKDLYQAALSYATHTKARREKAYQMLLDDPVGDEGEPGGAAPTGVRLSESGTVKLYMNQTLTLTATLLPDGASSALRWKSGSPRVATVEDGVVTPVKAGLTVVKVKTENGLTDAVAVRVKNVPATGVALSGEAKMKAGEKQTLSVTIEPADATVQTVAFKSGNPAVASVTQKGVVTAKTPGKAVIYCRVRDGSRTTGKIKITVK